MRELAASVSVSRSLGQVVRQRQPSAQRPEKSGRACGSMLGSGMFFSSNLDGSYVQSSSARSHVLKAQHLPTPQPLIPSTLNSLAQCEFHHQAS